MALSVERSSYVALCGGVGGAKLALGLAELLGDRLTIIVNTGDDFEHLGLAISPDIDTVIYTLAGLANLETGWGRAGETWSFMEALAGLGGPTWFKLGDKDLAMHVERTRWLAEGKALSAFCEHIRRRLGIAPAILPMSDDAGADPRDHGLMVNWRFRTISLRANASRPSPRSVMRERRRRGRLVRRSMRSAPRSSLA